MMGPGFFFGIPAIITGAIALKKKQDNRALSITGIITGSISTLISLLLVGLLIWAIVWTINNPQVLETPAPAPSDQSLFESTET
ncbi:MAG TPA: DUF4190 domain-containing protein [Candidatus Saccharimonadales bacterium]|nr:DUF4190 domain-containing protein [Candidatus Saccharimonadales bacterium]